MTQVVIELAKPILSFKSVKGGFGRYVKHWIVEGYTWNGECKCTSEKYSLEVPIFSLEVLEKDLKKAVLEQLEK